MSPLCSPPSSGCGPAGPAQPEQWGCSIVNWGEDEQDESEAAAVS